MNSFINTFFAQVQDFFGGLTPIKRVSLMASIGVGLAALATILVMSSGSDYAPLLSNVPPEQISTVLNTLRAKSIPHRIEDNSGTILVPKAYLHSTQMTIMSEVGAGRIGQVGLELFDKQDFGTTSYAQRINYQRALQGELSRAINSIDAVNRSKVILAIPKKKVFLDDGAKPKNQTYPISKRLVFEIPWQNETRVAQDHALRAQTQDKALPGIATSYSYAEHQRTL